MKQVFILSLEFEYVLRIYVSLCKLSLKNYYEN